MRVINQNTWKWLFLLAVFAAVLFAALMFYYKFKLQDREVMSCEFVLNDISNLSKNNLNNIVCARYRLIYYYYKQFNSELRGHPGKDFFLSRIKNSAVSNQDEIRRLNVLTEGQLRELLSITNRPENDRVYYFSNY